MTFSPIIIMRRKGKGEEIRSNHRMNSNTVLLRVQESLLLFIDFTLPYSYCCCKMSARTRKASFAEGRLASSIEQHFSTSQRYLSGVP